MVNKEKPTGETSGSPRPAPEHFLFTKETCEDIEETRYPTRADLRDAFLCLALRASCQVVPDVTCPNCEGRGYRWQAPTK